MELRESNSEEIRSIDCKLQLYSKKAILAFSVLFTPIYGATLLMHTLCNMGKRKTAYLILSGSVVYTILTIVIIFIPEKPIILLAFLLNLAGGLILSQKVYTLCIPHSDYHRKKKIWKPLIISIIIMLPLLFAVIFDYSIDY